MIWIYAIRGLEKLQTRKVTSSREAEAFIEEADWAWLNFITPNNEELTILSGLIKNEKVLLDIKEKKISPRPQRLNDFFILSIPLAFYNDKLKKTQIYLLVKEKLILTVEDKDSSILMGKALRTFEDCVGRICEGKTNSSFVVGRLFHEVTNANLDVVMALRENIDQLEQRALADPAKKGISRTVFNLKREISTLERILWSQKELMLNIREGVVLEIETTEEIEETLNHAISNISRELALIDSHNNALESILSLQNLGMIHRVERNLISLTLMALIVSVILILLEIDILSLLQAS